MNPYYRLAKSKEAPKVIKHHKRNQDDFREVDDMDTAIYYFEDGNFIFLICMSFIF
jgi:hypothetical protein